VLLCFTGRGNIEDEGFLLSNTPSLEDDSRRGDHTLRPEDPSPASEPPPEKTQPPSEHRSGSGFSGDDEGADLWSRQTSASPDITYNRGDGSLEVLPPPDLEVDTDEDLVAVEPPNTKQEDLVGKGEEFKETLQITKVHAVEESSSDGYIEELLLDQDLVTPHFSTDPRYSTTAQSPVFSPKDTLTVELSVHTVEASGPYEHYSLTEPYAVPVTDSLEPETVTQEAAASAGPTESGSKLQEATEDKDVTTETRVMLPVVTVASQSAEDVQEKKDREVTGASGQPEIPDAEELPTFVEVPTIPVRDSGFDTTTDESSPITHRTKTQGKMEVLEEQYLDTTFTTTTAAPAIKVPDPDMVVDEVMVVTPIPTSSVTSDHSSSIKLSPEKDSPFTRVSDSAPEDEDLFHHEHQNHDDVTEVPKSPPSPDVSVPGVTGSDPTDAALGASLPDQRPEPAGVDTQPSTEEIRPLEGEVEHLDIGVEPVGAAVCVGPGGAGEAQQDGGQLQPRRTDAQHANGSLQFDPRDGASRERS